MPLRVELGAPFGHADHDATFTDQVIQRERTAGWMDWCVEEYGVGAGRLVGEFAGLFMVHGQPKLTSTKIVIACVAALLHAARRERGRTEQLQWTPED